MKIYQSLLFLFIAIIAVFYTPSYLVTNTFVMIFIFGFISFLKPHTNLKIISSILIGYMIVITIFGYFLVKVVFSSTISTENMQLITYSGTILIDLLLFFALKYRWSLSLKFVEKMQLKSDIIKKLGPCIADSPLIFSVVIIISFNSLLLLWSINNTFEFSEVLLQFDFLRRSSQAVEIVITSFHLVILLGAHLIYKRKFA